ncbi:hypothetical protein MRB53_014898 [Persea americana]|uniref:Uncharacterized protein n=1 Tax=Persea americana TaxID=3435 RepID=A0ACC2KCF3_PERAE|nr:hypothetical protein MRB53_014898 [Persea americana]
MGVRVLAQEEDMMMLAIITTLDFDFDFDSGRMSLLVVEMVLLLLLLLVNSERRPVSVWFPVAEKTRTSVAENGDVGYGKDFRWQ